jgi:hypothetical protein
MRIFLSLLLATFFSVAIVPVANAQGLFQKSTFEKVEKSEAKAFDEQFEGMIWTAQGFNRQASVVDNLPTTELRARLQQVFGNPTKTVKDLIEEKKFGRSEGATIQFEYRFVVNDSIPVMLLDINGPFGQGLVWVGGNRWVDRMAQIKRDLAEEIMSTKTLAEFEDFFYSPEQEKWFSVRLKSGEFKTEELKKSPF